MKYKQMWRDEFHFQRAFDGPISGLEGVRELSRGMGIMEEKRTNPFVKSNGLDDCWRNYMVDERVA